MKLTYQLLDASEEDINIIVQAEKETFQLENRQLDIDLEKIKSAIKDKEIKIVANNNEKLGFFWAIPHYSTSYFKDIFYVRLTYLKEEYRKFFYPFILQAIKDCAKDAGYTEIFGDVFHSNYYSYKMHSKLAEPIYTVFRATI